MREFVYYSKNAVTAGNFIKDDLKKAGRIDIVCNVVIACFFVSNEIRKDVKLHLLFEGPPNSPRHLLFDSSEELPISKKDVAGLIKRMLYKCPDGSGLKKIYSGCYVEQKSFEHLTKELAIEGKNIFVLEDCGEDIRKQKFKGNEVYIIGDQEGFPREKSKLIKRIDKISVGPLVLFASQVFVLIHNEMDRRENET